MEEKIQDWKVKTLMNGGDITWIVPNGYVSYSSISKVYSSPKDWAEHYIHGNKQDLSHLIQIREGSNIADKRENDEWYGAKYPSLPLKEELFMKAIKMTNGKMIPIMAKIDCCSEDYMYLQDDKSADIYKKTPWSREKLYKENQFRLYSLMAYEITGKIPQFRVLVIDMLNGVELDTFSMFSVQYTMKELDEVREWVTEGVKRMGVEIINNLG